MKRPGTKDLLLIGKAVGAHGVKGEVKMLPYGDIDAERLEKIYLSADDAPVGVIRARRHKGVYILELEGHSDRDAASALAGRELYADRSEVPPLAEGEFYYQDLLGMEVVEEDGRHLGTVKNIIETGSNDVLEVTGPLGEVLIPSIEGSVLKVDVESGVITVRLLEGLLEEKGR